MCSYIKYQSRISNNKKHFGMLRLHVYPTMSDEFESKVAYTTI